MSRAVAFRAGAFAVLALLLLPFQAARAADRAAFSGSFTVTLKTSADRALPLFDPVGEARWSPGWAPVFARDSDRAALPDGTVFMAAGHGERLSTWVLQRYDRPGRQIVYTVYDPDGVVAGIRIAVRDSAGGTSEAVVRYDVVATTDAGDRFVRDFAAAFAHLGPHWQHALDAALAR
jgi:hypothetical protein